MLCPNCKEPQLIGSTECWHCHTPHPGQISQQQLALARRPPAAGTTLVKNAAIRSACGQTNTSKKKCWQNSLACCGNASCPTAQALPAETVHNCARIMREKAGNVTHKNVNKLGISPLGQLTARRAGVTDEQFASGELTTPGKHKERHRAETDETIRHAEDLFASGLHGTPISPLGRLGARRMGISEEQFARGEFK